jgi:transposase
LRAVGARSAWVFVLELFAWRRIKNRRELASLAGLTPTPYSSGESCHEQGISKAGNRRLRTMLVEIAWCWLRFQDQSALSQWYRQRFGSGSIRQRKIGIVALARKLLIALWKYLEHGEVPEGAKLTDWKTKLAKAAAQPLETAMAV